jgi:hypothetical protein
VGQMSEASSQVGLPGDGKNATRTLIGTRGSALSRMATGDTSENEQRIHTPLSILRPIAKLWPEGIECDPCGSPDSLVESRLTFGPSLVMTRHSQGRSA